MTIFQIVAKARDTEASEFRNIHHYSFFNYTPDSTQLQEAVDALDAAYKTELQATYHDDIEFYAYDVRRVDIGNLPGIEYVPTAGTWFGTQGTDRMPNQMAALVTFKTQTDYPRSTRNYMFPFGESANNALGRVTAATITQLTDWGEAILSLDITGGLDADKTAVEYGGTPRAVTDFNDVNIVSTTNVWGTQRRRKPGVGS